MLKYFCSLNKLMEQNRELLSSDSEQQFDRDFKPKGAIAFFILLILLGLFIWYGIYFLMLERI
jgi:hypothetical protein